MQDLAPMFWRQVSCIDGRGVMTIIMVMNETLPLAEIKARLSEIVDLVEQQHERYTLTRNGRPERF